MQKDPSQGLKTHRPRLYVLNRQMTSTESGIIPYTVPRASTMSLLIHCYVYYSLFTLVLIEYS